MIYIIIPVYNNILLTKKCLSSLMKQTLKHFKIIIVDDGSHDGTYEYISEFYPDVIIVQGSGSWWWTLSMNKGLEIAIEKASSSDYILSLNNDLEVNSDYLDNLLLCCQKNYPCIVGSVSVYDDDPERIDFAGAKWNRFTAKRIELFKNSHTYSQIKHYGPIETDLLPGRGTLFPVEVFKNVGIYDNKNFPQYIADQEFAIRAAKNGYRLLVEPSAVVYSNIKNTGINFKKGAKKSLKNIYHALFSIKSPIYLPGRFKFAIKHSPIGIFYFFIDFTRILTYVIKSRS